jgi:hypothetical protein
MRKPLKITLSVTACFGLLLGTTVLGMSDASAQQKCKEHLRNLAENSTYTQQLMIDVGDVPGHQVRVLEVHRTYPNAEPNCEGLKRVESWDRGTSDYINTNGPASGYTVTVLENGDKTFQRWSGTAQAVDNPDGSRTITFTGTYHYVGGTGKYRGLRGMGRTSCRFDPLANYNECTSDGEYWLE